MVITALEPKERDRRSRKQARFAQGGPGGGNAGRRFPDLLGRRKKVPSDALPHTPPGHSRRRGRGPGGQEGGQRKEVLRVQASAGKRCDGEAQPGGDRRKTKAGGGSSELRGRADAKALQRLLPPETQRSYVIFFRIKNITGSKIFRAPFITVWELGHYPDWL